MIIVHLFAVLGKRVGVNGLSEWKIPGFRDGQDWGVSEVVNRLRVDSRLRVNGEGRGSDAGAGLTV